MALALTLTLNSRQAEEERELVAFANFVHKV